MGWAWRFDAGELDDWLKSDKLALPDKWKNNKRQGRRPLNGKHAVWFAVWVALNPQEAIPKLEIYLAAIADAQKATEFAMRFVVNLNS